jgi:hypothetical protein
LAWKYTERDDRSAEGVNLGNCYASAEANLGDVHDAILSRASTLRPQSLEGALFGLMVAASDAEFVFEEMEDTPYRRKRERAALRAMEAAVRFLAEWGEIDLTAIGGDFLLPDYRDRFRDMDLVLNEGAAVEGRAKSRREA